MHKILRKLSTELDQELKNILNYWVVNTVDSVNGGFLGERDFNNTIVEGASKGIILNSRILWTFAATSNHYKTKEYEEICKRSYNYLKAYFKDDKFGGVFWEVDSQGNPLNKKKQVYAHAFMIYALTEYYLFINKSEILDWAIELFELIEKYSRDPEFKGYVEAFNQDWSLINDMRLSDKDENASKTMNTHLHVLESYTNLYKVTKNERVKNALIELIELFLTHFYNKEDGHMNLFFDDQWNLESNIISYGHDIETAWLLIEAAKVIQNLSLIEKTNQLAVVLADSFIKNGVDADGGVFYEYNKSAKVLDADKHWWPQAEAIVGLKYVYDFTANEKYLTIAEKIWNFTKENILDSNFGEWHWKVDKFGRPSMEDYKIGFWKAPYHNSRACIELSKLLY